MRLKSLPLLLLLSLVMITNGFAQSSKSDDALKIFVDCQTRCFRDYMQQELTWLRFMRDRQTAEVFIQVTSLRTGDGARAYSLEFIGQDRFEGMIDTVHYFTEPNSSDSDQRDLIIQALQNGLLPFLVQTSYLEKINYTIETDSSAENLNPFDPWKLWTFNIGGNFNISGEESFRNTRMSGRFSFGKVTEDYKWNSRFSYNYSNNFFVIDENETFRRIVTSKYFSSTYVKSVSDHLSVGVFANASESTFSNFALSTSFQPAVEWNYYPYLEANKRQFTIIYRIGPQYNNYVDTTIFDKDRELLFRHSIEFNYQKVENWGNIDIEISYGNFLHDWNLLFAYINPDVELNLFKGVYFNMGGNLGLTRNQVNIPKVNAEKEDVLLQIRQLKSNYNYFVYAGFGYRFGSNFSNVVNVRF